MATVAGLRSAIIGVVVGVAVAVFAGLGFAAPKAPRIETGPDAEVTHDGLYRVQKSVMDAAWVKPDLDLTGYTKLIITSGGVAFKKLAPVSSGRARTATEFPVSDEHKEQLKQELQQAFVEELAKIDRYEVVTEAGADTLLLVGYVIDVVSNVPPDVNDAMFGRGGVYLSSIGEATLVVELRDSHSLEVLARAADRRGAEPVGMMEYSEPMAWSEVRRLAQTWASLLRRRLEEIEGV